MANSHDFAQFTRPRYRELVRQAARRFQFVGYGDTIGADPVVWWRHDVDFSMHSSLRLAQIEAEEQCRATYFVSLRSPFYNLFEAAIAERVGAIIGLGHAVGLHFDAGYYQVRDEASLEESLLLEQAVVAANFRVPVTAFSFHNPNVVTDVFRADRYAGMVNVYSEFFRTQAGYVSDSNGYWRHQSLADALGSDAHQRLQVLTHPGWWQDDALPPRERIERCVRGRAEATLAEYDAALARAGRLNLRDSRSGKSEE